VSGKAADPLLYGWKGETMPESPRSKVAMYLFIAIGIAVIVGAGLYVLKGLVHLN
jgi:hypothetical protein